MLDYRLKKTQERFGPVELAIECIEDLNQTIDDLFLQLEREGNPALLEDLCPYFGVIWPSARALAEKVVESSADFGGQRVLELGCGLAIPSLVLAKLAPALGIAVTASDFHPEVPVFLRRNLALNQIDLRYLAMDWKSAPPPAVLYDWVIASDVLYEKEHPAVLAQALVRQLKPTGRVLIADPARPYLQRFADEMRALGLEYTTQIRKVPDHPLPKEIFLLSFARF